MNELLPLTIGADPEFFVRDKELKMFVSAHDLVPGTKDKPMPCGEGSVQVDGLALEIGIRPAYSAGEFARNIKNCLGEVRKIVPQKLEFSYVPTAWFDKQYYDEAVPPQAKVLGCTPDRDAYKNGAFNPCPEVKTSSKGVMRTGAGHLHLGWTDKADVVHPQHIYDCILLTKNLDAIFEPISQLWDKDTERREMYGKPGAFRVKPYGCEYRTLSNAWLADEKWYPFVFQLAEYGFYATQHGIDLSTKDWLKTMSTPASYNKYRTASTFQQGTSVRYFQTIYRTLPVLPNGVR